MVRISSSRLNMEDGRIDRPILKDYGETLVGGSAGTNTTATYTADISTGNVFNLILNANCTFTFSNPSPAGTACNITIYLKQDATGGRTATWPSTVKWSGDVVPNVTSIAGRWDIFTFVTTNGGLTWFGMQTGQNYGKASGGYLYTAWSWGDNASGQLGQNTATATDLSSPVQIGTLNNWTKLTAGNLHTAGIKTDGTLWTLGDNSQGQLGQNLASAVNISSPAQLGTLTSWNSLASGRAFVLATKSDGTLWVWGNNNHGQQGINTNGLTQLSSPTQIGTLTNWASVTGGRYHSIATKTDGTLWAWGRANQAQLGLDDIVSRSSPVQVGTLTNWSSVNTGNAHTFATKTDGTLWAWGYNSFGRLGLNHAAVVSSPAQVGTLTNWASATAAYFHSHATKTDGTLWSWGYNNQGNLGQNTIISVSSPVQIGTLTNWTSVVGGLNHSAAIKSDGTLWNWGINTQGQLGQNSISTAKTSSPVQVGTLNAWAGVAAGDVNIVAMRSA